MSPMMICYLHMIFDVFFLERLCRIALSDSSPRYLVTIIKNLGQKPILRLLRQCSSCLEIGIASKTITIYKIGLQFNTTNNPFPPCLNSMNDVFLFN